MEGLAQLLSISRTAFNIYWDNKRIRDRFDIVLIQQAKTDLLAVIPGLVIYFIPIQQLKVSVIRRFPSLYPFVFVTPTLYSLVLKDATAWRTNEAMNVLKLLSDVSTRSVESHDTDLRLQRLNALIARAKQQYENPTIVIPYTQLQPLFDHFRSHLSPLNMSHSELTVLTRYLNFTTRRSIPSASLDQSIRMFVPLPPLEKLTQWADWIVKDDQLIRHVGVKSLNDYEVTMALYERGYIHLKQSIPDLRNTLTAWLKFSDVALQYLIKRRVSESGLAVSRDNAIAPEDLAVMASIMIAGQAIVTSNAYSIAHATLS
ncbi:hypothetical protein SmJEL517_g04301 [Synchytrium microbalum]|uniref:Letm1 RBD domain-containing protein n=1 Tax=Synchytrium microbalum TaxID=1806994 RepID=A0A507C3B8_9FUNG|nr:uncharacterized protein SmJEL517_g04301 [Synchytrium microbalum]TPX32584.1 hypothetical protein SmJEL517_g04301 [Synchytrium microbalum]